MNVFINKDLLTVIILLLYSSPSSLSLSVCVSLFFKYSSISSSKAWMLSSFISVRDFLSELSLSLKKLYKAKKFYKCRLLLVRPNVVLTSCPKAAGSSSPYLHTGTTKIRLTDKFH